ncbi:collagen alpha-2(I) chain-like isoform X2 [Numida meleagris]|uniref:collagen alpha-2(I) chain-like isoform X2 n=1 Tax=Numida meleagris TaxID=8996 RepID=UPI000B3E1CA7|nr:collagen alpha-2(I) chain-like isoform X2 [Numida meleagris]
MRFSKTPPGQSRCTRQAVPSENQGRAGLPDGARGPGGRGAAPGAVPPPTRSRLPAGQPCAEATRGARTRQRQRRAEIGAQAPAVPPPGRSGGAGGTGPRRSGAEGTRRDGTAVRPGLRAPRRSRDPHPVPAGTRASPPLRLSLSAPSSGALCCSGVGGTSTCSWRLHAAPGNLPAARTAASLPSAYTDAIPLCVLETRAADRNLYPVIKSNTTEPVVSDERGAASRRRLPTGKQAAQVDGQSGNGGMLERDQTIQN